jgi:hypothetical protein
VVDADCRVRLDEGCVVDVPLKLHLDVVTNVKVKVMAEGSGASK